MSTESYVQTPGRFDIIPPITPPLVLEAWRDWLGNRPWSHFITVTYRQPRRLRSDGGDLSRVLSVIRERVTRAPVFLAGEAHSTGDLHVHGVLNVSHYAAASQRRVADQLWGSLERRFGRSQVRRVQDAEAVANYCTKYVTKQMAAYLID